MSVCSAREVLADTAGTRAGQPRTCAALGAYSEATGRDEACVMNRPNRFKRPNCPTTTHVFDSMDAAKWQAEEWEQAVPSDMPRRRRWPALQSVSGERRRFLLAQGGGVGCAVAITVPRPVVAT
jgi:hypothetical protein